MDEMFALAAGLQFAYWFWNATIQPGMTRFSDSIGTTLGEISSERLRRWFGAEPPRNVQGEVDESELAQQQRITIAKENAENDPEWNTKRFMDITKRQLVRLLRDPLLYSWEQIEIFWSDYADPERDFIDIKNKHTQSRNGVAHELVMESIQRKTLPQLIAAMRQARA